MPSLKTDEPRAYLEVVAEPELQRLGGLLEEALVQLDLSVQKVGVRVRLV